MKKLLLSAGRHLPRSVAQPTFRRLCTRTDEQYLELVRQRLPGLWEESQHQFAPAWSTISDAVAADSLRVPTTVLDLASGGAAEPACTLAARFLDATIVASDNDEAVLQIAAHRISDLGLSDRVELQVIDLADLVTLGKAEPADGHQIADAITCSLGLFMVSDSELCLRGVRALLKPGGLLCATVWDRMPMIELGRRCIGRLLNEIGRETPRLKIDPVALGHGRADAALAAAGYELTTHHNTVHSISLNLGKLGEDRAWMLGLLPFQGSLTVLHEQHVPRAFQRARSAFEEEVVEAGYVDENGDVVLRGLDYRLLCARKPL